jgi:hypothetical protein
VGDHNHRTHSMSVQAIFSEFLYYPQCMRKNSKAKNQRKFKEMVLRCGLNHAKRRIGQSGVDQAKAQFIADFQNPRRAAKLSAAKVE